MAGAGRPPRCASGGGRPQGQGPRLAGPRRLRAPPRRRGRGRSDHLVQTGVSGLDCSEVIQNHQDKAHYSHHNPQLWVEWQPWAQLSGPRDEEEVCSKPLCHLSGFSPPDPQRVMVTEAAQVGHMVLGCLFGSDLRVKADKRPCFPAISPRPGSTPGLESDHLLSF